MKAELEKLARHRLSRTEGAFSEGNHLPTVKAFAGAVNRFYYAAFYAARALLAIRELDSSRHSGVISLFQAQFVKPGLIATEKAKPYRVPLRSGRRATTAIFYCHGEGGTSHSK